MNRVRAESSFCSKKISYPTLGPTIMENKFSKFPTARKGNTKWSHLSDKGISIFIMFFKLSDKTRQSIPNLTTTEYGQPI